MHQLGRIALVLIRVVEPPTTHHELCDMRELEPQLFVPVPVGYRSYVVANQLIYDVDVVDEVEDEGFEFQLR
jgi:hypothetical protein